MWHFHLSFCSSSTTISTNLLASKQMETPSPPQASASRKRAAAAEKELEAERKAGEQLRRVRDMLQAAAASDKKSIAR